MVFAFAAEYESCALLSIGDTAKYQTPGATREKLVKACLVWNGTRLSDCFK